MSADPLTTAILVIPLTGDSAPLVRLNPTLLLGERNPATALRVASPRHWFAWLPHFFTRQIPHFFTHLLPDWFPWLPHFFTRQIPHFFTHLLPDWFASLRHWFVSLHHAGMPVWALAAAAAVALAVLAGSVAWLLRARASQRSRTRALYPPPPPSSRLLNRGTSRSTTRPKLRRPPVPGRTRSPTSGRPVPQRPARSWRRAASILGLGTAGRERRTRRRSPVAALAGDQLDWAEQAVNALGLHDEDIDCLRHAIRAKLADRIVRVAVVGEFSSGKSTLVNALCRERLLPSAAAATTSVVTRLESGHGAATVTLTSGGRSYTLPKDATALGQALRSGSAALFPSGLAEGLKLLTADKDISARVDTLTVRWNAPFLARGVVLLDTPGLNSTRRGHAELARTAVAEADLLILLIPSFQSVTESLRQVIAEHMQLRPRSVAFCLTQTDLLDADELKAVVEDTVMTLRDVTGLAEPEVRAVAALPALEAVLARRPDDPAICAFEEFEAGITALARQGREGILGEVAARQVNGLLEKVDTAIVARTQQLRSSAAALRGNPVADLNACLDRWSTATRHTLRTASAAAMRDAESEADALEGSFQNRLDEALLGPRNMDGTIANLDNIVPGLLENFGSNVEAAFIRRHDQPVIAAFTRAAAEVRGRIENEVIPGSGFTGRAAALPTAAPPYRTRVLSRPVDLGDIRNDAVAARRSLPGIFRRFFRGGGREALEAAQRQVYRAVLSRARGMSGQARDASVATGSAMSRAVDAHAAGCRQAWWDIISGLEADRRARERDLLADASRGEELRSEIPGRRRDLNHAIRESSRKEARR
jgi:GTPase SAR1 family protein